METYLERRTFVIFATVLDTLGAFFSALSYIKILHKSVIIQYSYKLLKSPALFHVVMYC